MSPANVAVHYFVWKEKNWGHCCWALDICVSVIEEWRSCNKYTSKMRFRKELVCMKTIAIKHIDNIPIINFVFTCIKYMNYKLLFEQWKPDPQCSKNALFQSNTTRHTLAYKNKNIKTSDSMNGFCTTQIDQVFFVVHLRTKVIPTRINISQHLYHPISQDKLICITNCRYYENMRTEKL